MIRQNTMRYRTVRASASSDVSAPLVAGHPLIAQRPRDVSTPPDVIAPVPVGSWGTIVRLSGRGRLFYTVGVLKPSPPYTPTGPIIAPRGVLDQTAQMRAASRQPPSKAVRYTSEPTPRTASTVGIVASGGTTITMVPADLTVQGRTDITQFVTVSLDAGVY